ncbi:MAG: hypothetical protein WA951_07245 [Leeuwenhoekiella sp.]
MIAYYAHQHGSGHANCAQLFAEASPEQVIIFTSYAFSFSSGTQVVFLPSEDPDGTAAPSDTYDLPGYLHYSPVGQQSIQQRSAVLLNECIAKDVKLLIIDVSVEIAALARASSIPYAFVRLQGKRSDMAHLEAFRGAVFLLAYYPEALEMSETPKWVRDKTIYLGFLSRFPCLEIETGSKRLDTIAVLSGSGGNLGLTAILPRLFKRFRHSKIDVFGDYKEMNISETVQYHGHRSDIYEYLKNADAIVTSCGLNTISELLHLKKTIIAIAEERPYQEQVCFLEQLIKEGLVSTTAFAMENSDAAILNSIKDPSRFVGEEQLKFFLEILSENENIWELNLKERINNNGVYINHPSI